MLTKRPPNLEAIPQIFCKYPSVLAVYLFGSYAAGKPRFDSDVDLAIVPRDEKAREHMLEMMADLIRKVYDRIDLVILDTQDVVLRFEAVRHNRLLYRTPEFDPGTYTSRIAREYWDFLPYLNVQRRALKQRILGHGTP
ncbi:MAG: nucleotidyltransferase domain-containing protein [Anaerolineales bacterium]